MGTLSRRTNVRAVLIRGEQEDQGKKKEMGSRTGSWSKEPKM
jgi:hypothetical protein